jgi:hypothetical protein
MRASVNGGSLFDWYSLLLLFQLLLRVFCLLA